MNPTKIKIATLRSDTRFEKLQSYTQYLNEKMQVELTRKIDDVCVEGLRRKGFEFNNPMEIEAFIKERCRCEDNIHFKERVYYVDETPFLLHKYEIKMDFDMSVTERKTIMTGSAGEYVYL